MGDTYTITSACANMKMSFPRLASKGRWARSNLETSRIEIILKGSEIPKGVTVKAPAKSSEAKKSEAKAPAAPAKKPEEPVIGTPPVSKPPATVLKDEAKAEHEHKHEAEKEFEQEKKHEEAEPHHHGEYKKR
jgi:hypothetical protein